MAGWRGWGEDSIYFDHSAAGVACIDAFVPHYIVGWTLGYSGNMFPSLTHLKSAVAPGDEILLQLYYDQIEVHFTAADNTTGNTSWMGLPERIQDSGLHRPKAPIGRRITLPMIHAQGLGARHPCQRPGDEIVNGPP